MKACGTRSVDDDPVLPRRHRHGHRQPIPGATPAAAGAGGRRSLPGSAAAATAQLGPGRRSTPPGLDAVVVSHAHLDHTGYLPALGRSGSDRARSSRPTTPLRLAELVLRDSAKLQEEDAAYAAEQGLLQAREPEAALRRAGTSSACCRSSSPVRLRRRASCSARDLTTRLRPAGHILGSASVLLESPLRVGLVQRRPRTPSPSAARATGATAVGRHPGDRVDLRRPKTPRVRRRRARRHRPAHRRSRRCRGHPRLRGRPHRGAAGGVGSAHLARARSPRCPSTSTARWRCRCLTSTERRCATDGATCGTASRSLLDVAGLREARTALESQRAERPRITRASSSPPRGWLPVDASCTT